MATPTQLQPGDDALFFSMASASPFDSSEDPEDGKNNVIGGDEQILPQYRNRSNSLPRPRIGPRGPLPFVRLTPGAGDVP